MAVKTPKCRCGHTLSWHMDAGPGVPRFCVTTRCMNVCWDYAPVVIEPKPGERPIFGVHRMPPEAAETAEAWPPLPSWSARVKSRTSRALRSLK